MTVLVTAIMPLKYYTPAFLQQALDAMKHQSDPDWRLLIVVEDSDYDALFEYLRPELADPRVDLVVTERPGFVGSINTGIQKAATPFTGLLFADDRWAPDAVRILNRHIREYPDVDFFHSSRMIIDASGAVISPVFKSEADIDLDAFKWGSPVKHLLCWRKTKALQIGGIDESLADHGPDDYDFPWSMAERGATFKAIDACLYYYRNHGEHYRLSTHVPRARMKNEVDKILKKHGVPWWERKMIIWKRSRNGSLGGQSMYRNAIAQWIQTRLGIDGSRRWKQTEY